MKDIAFHVTDIAENCIRAGADRIGIEIRLDGRALTLKVEDNGCGMSEETIQKAINPFYTTRTTRKVGLGLPFLIQNAEQTGGDVKIESAVEKGTTVQARFMMDNIDCPPTGDLAETAMHIIVGNPSINTVLTLASDGEVFEISTQELLEIMDGVPLGHPQVATLVKEIIEGSMDEIFKGKLKI